LLEEVELLQGLQSVDCKHQFIISTHTETGHVVLQLYIIEDDSGDVVGILLCKNLIWSCFYLGEEFTSVILNCFGDLLAQFSGVIIFLGLRETDSE